MEDTIKEVVTAMEGFRSQQWRYEKGGKEVIVNEVINSALDRIRTYAEIGNIMIQHDPIFTALAWGGFRCLLQAIATLIRYLLALTN